MPWITVNMLEGHSREQKDCLHHSLTAAVCASLDVPIEYVQIQIVEMKPENNSVGGLAIDKLPK